MSLAVQRQCTNWLKPTKSMISPMLPPKKNSIILAFKQKHTKKNSFDVMLRFQFDWNFAIMFEYVPFFLVDCTRLNTIRNILNLTNIL